MSTEFRGEGFYAKIKYLDDGDKSTIPITDVLEFQNIKPQQASKEFDKESVYTVMWYDKNDQPMRLAIQISAVQSKSIKFVYYY